MDIDRPARDLDRVVDGRLDAEATSSEKAATTSAGIHGAPRRAVMSEGFRSSGSVL